jgi:hypothetical protein
MDIGERAEKWAREHTQANDLSDFGPGIEEELIAAYLAGSQQTQADYASYSVPVQTWPGAEPALTAAEQNMKNWRDSYGWESREYPRPDPR